MAEEYESLFGRYAKYLLLLLVVFIVFLIANPIVIVPAGYKGVTLTWGAVTGQPLDPGIHFIMPIVQSVKLMDVRTQKYEAKAEAATQDLLDVTTDVAVNYHLDPAQVNTVYQKLGTNYQDSIINPAVQEVVKASTANFNAKQLITDRADVKLRIDNALQERLAERGIILETTSITDFNFPVTFNDAITAAQTSTQQVEKAKNDLLRIQVEAQQAVAQATGQSQAIEIINDQLEKAPHYIEWQAIQKWDGKMPLSTGGAMPFIQIPTYAVNSTTATQ